MGAMVSEITSLVIVYSTVYSGASHQNSPVTSELPTQMVSYAENASIWWRHHDKMITSKISHVHMQW